MWKAVVEDILLPLSLSAYVALRNLFIFHFDEHRNYGSDCISYRIIKITACTECRESEGKTVCGFFFHINPSKIVSSHSRKDLFIFHAMTKALRAFFYERLNEGKLDERDNHRNYVTLKSLIGKVFFGTEIDKIWAFLLF